MKHNHDLLKTVFLSFSILLVGCAQTKTSQVQQFAPDNLKRPSRILVQDFSSDPGAIKSSSTPLAKIEDMASGDDGKGSRAALIKEVDGALSDELVERLKKLGFEAVRVGSAQQAGADEIMIKGQFTNVDEGNAVRRAMIGFGAGQSSVDAKVSIVASGGQALVTMKAHADSGETPGAAVTAGVGAAAQAGTAATAAVSVAKGGAKAYQSASAHQASEIADKVSEEFEKFAKKQGWISLK